MEKITLQAEPRTALGKQNKQLRAEGKIPGVVYGHSVSSESIAFDAKQLEKIYQISGSSKLIELKVGDASGHNVLFQEVQLDSRTGAITHVDLYQVRMDEKIKTELPLRFVGESTAVYQQEGTLLKNIETLEIEALPGDLPEAIEVDISILDDFDKTIHVSDLVSPSGVTILNDPEELVVKVEPPRSDEEMAELDEDIVAELPEGVAEEGAEGAEGEAGDKPAAEAGDKEAKPE
jgi:large subunit ribosomal protein L25